MRGFSEGKSKASKHTQRNELIISTVLILYGVVNRREL